MKKNSATGLKFWRVIALFFLLLVGLLLTYMVKVEGEPGALPLLLLLSGMSWLVMIQFRLHKMKKVE